VKGAQLSDRTACYTRLTLNPVEERSFQTGKASRFGKGVDQAGLSVRTQHFGKQKEMGVIERNCRFCEDGHAKSVGGNIPGRKKEYACVVLQPPESAALLALTSRTSLEDCIWQRRTVDDVT
jgi:hypothetical protein